MKPSMHEQFGFRPYTYDELEASPIVQAALTQVWPDDDRNDDHYRRDMRSYDHLLTYAALLEEAVVNLEELIERRAGVIEKVLGAFVETIVEDEYEQSGTWAIKTPNADDHSTWIQPFSEILSNVLNSYINPTTIEVIESRVELTLECGDEGSGR